MRLKSLFDDTRGVAPVVGQVILFTLIIGTVLGTAAVALPLFEERQAGLQQEVMVDAADEFNHVAIEAALTGQSKAPSISVPAGDISLGQSQTEILFDNGTETHTVESAPVTFATGEAKIAYEAGLVGAANRDEANTVRSQPQQITTHDAVTQYRFQFTELEHAEPRRITNSQAADFVAVIEPSANEQQTSTFNSESVGDVSITVQTEQVELWEAYIENHAAYENVEAAEGEVSADVASSTEITVTSTPVTVSAPD